MDWPLSSKDPPDRWSYPYDHKPYDTNPMILVHPSPKSSVFKKAKQKGVFIVLTHSKAHREPTGRINELHLRVINLYTVDSQQCRGEGP